MAKQKLSEKMLKALAARFLALSEVSRLKIIQELQRGPCTVSELVEKTGLQQSNVSRHLKILTDVGLLTNRKSGVSVIYSIADATLDDVCAIVCRSVVTQSVGESRVK
jgi:DNA-binding transcriptional ArsR family regulator